MHNAASGGGYKKRNVARCWTYETAVLVGQEHLITDQIPDNIYIDNFRNDKEFSSQNQNLSDKMNLDFKGTLENFNKPAQIERTMITALEHLRHLEFAPGEHVKKFSLILHCAVASLAFMFGCVLYCILCASSRSTL